MGFVRARFTVSDVKKTGREQIDFLVDSGSRFLVLPAKIAARLGLKTLTKTDLMLADKRLIEARIAACLVGWKGKDAPVFAAILDVPEPLIGVEALEALGLSVDPSSREVRVTRKHPSYLL